MVLKILRNSQENTYATSLFLIKLQASPITPPGDCFCQLNLNEKKN